MTVRSRASEPDPSSGPARYSMRMRPNARIPFVFFAVLLGSAGCDHASKAVAISALTGSGTVSLAGGALQLELTSNPGAFLSLGAGLPEGVRVVVFLVLVPLLALWLCAHLLRRPEASARLAVGLGLIAGGGLANWFDRLLHGGSVTDFLTVGWGPVRTGVFNVADVAVVLGIMVLVVFLRDPRALTRGLRPRRVPRSTPRGVGSRVAAPSRPAVGHRDAK